MYKQNRTEHNKAKHSKGTQSSLSLAVIARTKEYHSCFPTFCVLRSAFRFLCLTLYTRFNTRWHFRSAISIHPIFFSIFKLELNEFNARKPQIIFQRIWGLLYLPRICVFCVQFKEIVPRIVWPEEYVCCGLSRLILIFSIFSSLGGDWRGSDGVDVDVVVVVVVVIVVATGSTLGVTVVISLELWLILRIEND